MSIGEADDQSIYRSRCMGGAEVVTETVVLVFTDVSVDLDRLAQVVRSCGESVSHGGVLTVSDRSESVHVVRVTDLERDGVFEDWPSRIVPSGPVAVFSLDYRDPVFVVRVVRSIAGRWPCVVDTNLGRVLDGSELEVADLYS